MNGKQISMLFNWMSEFADQSSNQYDQRDIDYFFRELDRKSWIYKSWGIFNKMIEQMNIHQYDYSICLSFPLRTSKHPKKGPSKIKRKILSQRTPPGISLIRHSIIERVKSELSTPLINYDVRDPQCKCYLFQQKIDGVYYRWINIYYLG